MNVKSIITCMIVLFSIISTTNASDVEPILNTYSNVFPELAHQTLKVSRPTDVGGPWYVSFNLLATADVKIGAYAIPVSAGKLSISSIRIVTIDGENVVFGTDVISDEPFPEPVEHLVIANHLEPGFYALEISGSGRRTGNPELITRLSVTSLSPETEYEQGRSFGRQECIDNPIDCGISVTGEAVLTENLNMSIPFIKWNTSIPAVLWADLEYVPTNYTPASNDILFKVTDYGFIE